MDWQPIEMAPKDGVIYVVAVAGEDEWTTASWLADHFGPDREWREGWVENGLWMNPQPTHYLSVPPIPAPRWSAAIAYDLPMPKYEYQNPATGCFSLPYTPPKTQKTPPA